MEVVHASNGQEQYHLDEVVTHSCDATAVAYNQDGAVAVHHKENIHGGCIYRETPSGAEVVGQYIVVETCTIVAIAQRVRSYVEEANEDFLAHESRGERCADIICQACGCQFSNLCSCKRISDIVNKPKQILSDHLRKARNLGMKFLFLDGLIFPILHHIIRDLVVSGELLYTFAGLILSVLNYVNADCHQVFNLVSFVIGIIAALLTIASSVQALYKRSVCRKCCNKNDGKEDRENSGFTQLIDLLRTVLAELLIYPLLICSIFNLVTSRPFEAGTTNDIVGLVRFAISAASFVIFVYILRLVIIASAILKIRKFKTICFLVYFFVHVALQMVVQAFMIVVTGREIYEENLHFYNVSNYTNSESSCLPVMVSGYLWYMIIGTYLFPIMGLIMFFVVGYYRIQEFYISIYINSINVLMLLKCAPTTQTHIGKEAKKMIQSLSPEEKKDFDSLLPQGKVEEEFDSFRMTSCCTKFLYPFKRPALVIPCIIFLILNYLFITFGSEVSAIGPISFFLAFVDSTGWSVVYFAGAIFGVFANAYAFLVGVVWLILIEIIIFIIILLFPCFLILCFCYGCKSSESD